jgi:hypothetical protein
VDISKKKKKKKKKERNIINYVKYNLLSEFFALFVRAFARDFLSMNKYSMFQKIYIYL